MSLSVSAADSVVEPKSNLQWEWSVREDDRTVWLACPSLLSLLWRDGRALLFWLGVSCALSLLIMAWSMVTYLGNREAEVDFEALLMLRWLYLQAWLGPVMFLLGALASGFASERESTSFQWCSSLPVRWYESWLVKLILALIGAVVCWAICWYAAEIWGQYLPWQRATLSQINSRRALPVEMAGYWPYVLAIYSVGVLYILLTRQVITGVFLAMSVSLVLLLAWGEARLSVVNGLPTDTTQLYRFYLWLVDPLVLGLGLLLLSGLVYRWRWNRGMYSSGWFGWLGGVRRATAAAGAVVAWGPVWRPPATAVALVWLAWRKVFLLWCWCGAAAFLLFLSGQVDRSGNTSPWLFAIFPLSMLALFLLFGLSSVWSVVGERAGEPQSCLAERGVSPTAYWWSRYGVVVLGGVVLLTGLYVSLHELGRLTQRVAVPPLPREGYVWTLLIFGLAVQAIGSLGMLAGQLLRSWELAIFGLIASTVLLLMLAFNAAETSGLAGLLWSWGLVLAVAPLSWAVTWLGLARWQPRMGWMYAVVVLGIIGASLLGVSWLRVQVLPPANPVLAQARRLPAIDANILHGFRHRHFQKFREGVTPEETEDLRSAVRLAQSELEHLLAWIESCEAPDFDPATIDTRLGPRFRDTASASATESIPYEELTMGEMSELRVRFATLSENALIALQVGEWEVAELLLKLRVKLLSAARPIVGICGLDVHQHAFLESLSYRASDEAIVGLHAMLKKDPHLLTGDPAQAHQQWMAAMESQFSFIYRTGFVPDDPGSDLVTSVDATAGLESDRWQRELQAGRSFHSRATLPWSLWPRSVQAAWERERYQREVGAAYAKFQNYCRTGRLPQDLSESDVGKRIANHRLFRQIDHWALERNLAAYITLGRAAALVPE